MLSRTTGPLAAIPYHTRMLTLLQLLASFLRDLLTLGELGKIGIEVAKSTVERYMIRRRNPPTPTWRAFLKNHVKDILAVDFFVAPTVRNHVLFVFLLLAHDRRRVIHFNLTANPTAAWTARQIVEAFPWQDPPKCLLRDRDKTYGKAFQERVTAVGFEEVLTAARSPWQNPEELACPGVIRGPAKPA
jgi:putative transposase